MLRCDKVGSFKARLVESSIFMHVSIMSLRSTPQYVFSSTRLCVAVLLAALVGGCSVPRVNERTNAPEQSARIVPQTPVPMPALVDHFSSSIVGAQLKKAAAFFDKGMLISPDQDNAYIRYRAVLILDPTNTLAQSGLDGILVHEAGEAKQLLESSRFTAAEKRVEQLVSLFGTNHLLEDLAKNVALARTQDRKRRELEASRAADKQKRDDRIALDVAQLREKAPALSQTLGVIARDVQRADQSILIYARNDAEGRWIYKQMRKATPSYRIRGDIRIGRPGIELLARDNE